MVITPSSQLEWQTQTLPSSASASASAPPSRLDRAPSIEKTASIEKTSIEKTSIEKSTSIRETAVVDESSSNESSGSSIGTTFLSKSSSRSSSSSSSNSSSDSLDDDYSPWDGDPAVAHAIDAAHIARKHNVILQHGLDSKEAAARLERDGPNCLESAGGVPAWKILLRQVSNSLTIVLVIAMALSYGTSDFVEGAVISAVIVLNIVLGFAQDFRAEKTMRSLQGLSTPTCKVLRNQGKMDSFKTETLVVGDILHISAGDIVPADIRIFDGVNLEINEAPLTGESLPVVKTPKVTFEQLDVPLADRTNCAYLATTVSKGRGTGIVIATGMQTEVGRIAEMLLDRECSKDTNDSVFARHAKKFWLGTKNALGLTGTPLQVSLSKFAILLFALAVLLAIIVFSVDKWHLSNQVVIYGICVAIAVIPESLIAVLAITQAIGIKSMARGHVIVRKMQALEAIGGITHICSDKTGTLTQGKMIARKAWVPSMGTLVVQDTTDIFDPTSGHAMLGDKRIDKADELGLLAPLLNAIALCNLSSVYNNLEESNEKIASAWTGIGEPTDIALHVLAMRFGRGKEDILADGNVAFVAEHPFDSTIKRMSVAYQNRAGDAVDIFLKGAGEAVLPKLNSTPGERAEIEKRMAELAQEGLRVLCIANKSVPLSSAASVVDREWAESSLDFLGLVGLYDPPRLETAGAIAACKQAGISIHMLTGDHIDTATAISREIGLLTEDSFVASNKHTLTMRGGEFDTLSDAEIDALDALPAVLARCSPATKVRMVDALHRRSAFCVMTGDGVNDAPALKRADVGVAMGLNGSDVAKEASDMVLTDDDFASIVRAVEEGRRLFDNIQKFLLHLLICNIAQVILLLIALAFSDANGDTVFPMSPLEILWVNMITSSFLALGLGMEEKTPDIMLRPPHPLRAGVFTRELIVDKMVYGTLMGGLCLAVFVIVVYGGGGGNFGSGCNEKFNDSCGAVFRARSTTFATLSFLILVTAWEVKHFNRSLFALDPARYGTGVRGLGRALWYNRFLFWAVVAGFVVTFPVMYIPTVNTVAFKHAGLSWEWGVVVGCLAVYMAGIEAWKAGKRRWGGYMFGNVRAVKGGEV